MNPKDLAELITALVAAGGAIGGVLWWLVWPRIEDKLQAVARSVGNVNEQLQGDRPDTIGGHAKAAAQQLPELRGAVQQLAEQHAELHAWRMGVDRRLASNEQALIALLGTELRNRVLADDNPSTTPEREVTT